MLLLTRLFVLQLRNACQQKSTSPSHDYLKWGMTEQLVNHL